jgi:hypothetical protein
MRIALAVLAALGTMLAGCGGGPDQGSRAADAPTTTGATSAPTRARDPAPDIGGETLDGAALSLSDFRGRPVLVNVWSSW